MAATGKRATGPRKPRTRSGLLAFLGAASPLLLAALAVDEGWALALLAFLAAAFPVALMALGAVQRGRLGSLALVFAVLLLVLAAGLGALLALRGQGVEEPRFGGLPPPAAVQLLGLTLVPLVLVALAYALAFDRRGVTEEDLERLRRLAAAAAEEEG